MANPFSETFNALYPEPAEPTEQDYFAAVGKLITGYAGAEQAVHSLARRLSKLTDAKARIIFSGMRIGEIADRIRGLLLVTKASQKRTNEINACLAQLDRIAEQRNRLAHRWVHYFDGKLVCSNVVNAKHVANTEVVYFDIKQLRAMQADCLAISFRLVNVGAKNVDRAPLRWAQSPWRYIPAPQAPQKKQRAKGSQSQPRQRLSSRQRREAALARKK